MADVDLDAVRREFADLTALLEDAAFFATDGQGIRSLGSGRREFNRLLRAIDRIRKRLGALERRLR